jgi:hypothetical protein
MARIRAASERPATRLGAQALRLKTGRLLFRGDHDVQWLCLMAFYRVGNEVGGGRLAALERIDGTLLTYKY